MNTIREVQCLESPYKHRKLKKQLVRFINYN